MEHGARAQVLRGVRAGIPVAFGYVPMAVAFGILAARAGLGVGPAAAMSVFVYAGASQFASLSLIAGGSSALAISLATLVLNFRHFLMSVSLSRRLPPAPPGRTVWAASVGLGFGITDETFVVASMEDALTPAFFAGLIATAYVAWVAGTLIGASFGPLIPSFLASGMGMALYAMFIAILVPGVKKSWANGVVAAAGGFLAWVLTIPFPSLPQGWRIVLAILAASALGACVREDT